jgi:hypothetical protein
MATAAKSVEISVLEVSRGNMEFCILGTSPLIMNRMANKGVHELLAPKRKTAADKAGSLKHDPIREFRDSAYRMPGDNPPALLAMMTTAFKGGMRTASMDIPGASKTQTGRLVYMPGEYQPIFGIPRLFMSVVRSADMNRTPDVRTRVIVPEWACRLSVVFTKPMLKEQSVANLLAAAGMSAGVGDWRQEKGSGSYGSFKLVGEDDPDFVRITSKQGRAAQQEAMDFPVPYNEETAEMLSWFSAEMARRGVEVTV